VPLAPAFEGICGGIDAAVIVVVVFTGQTEYVGKIHEIDEPACRPVDPGPGSATSVVYDTLRSSSPSDFHGPAICIEEDGLDLVAEDLAAAGTSETYYYLIRDENACPGGIGSMGAASSGAPRTGLSCPQDY
jgi:hypothetical protein